MKIKYFVFGALAATAFCVSLGLIQNAKTSQAPSGVVPSFAVRPPSFADLAEDVSPAVVNISTSKLIRSPRMAQPFSSPFGRDPFFDDFFERFFEGVPQEQRQNSLGSGFIIDKDGTILTNRHVISGADDVEVKLSDGRTFKAKILGEDERTDIAIIKIEAQADFPTVVLGSSDDLRPGDWVMAIGNPFGLELTVTVGVVSATGRKVKGAPIVGTRFIQTDASINPGNSGGPLFNTKGEVVGINTMIDVRGQGIGFAIPIDLARKIAPQLKVEGRVIKRGWLGVRMQEMTPELAKSFGLKEPEGVVVVEVVPGSPAEKAGLKRGDVVVTYNGEKVADIQDLSLAVSHTDAGKEVVIEIVRDGKKESTTATIGTLDDDTVAQLGGEESAEGDVLGFVVKNITPQDAAQLGLPQDLKAVVIVRIEPNSVAERYAFRSGDVIIEINGTRIETIDRYKESVKKLKKGDLVRIFYQRGNVTSYLAFNL